MIAEGEVAPESGPFRVENQTDSNPTIFENLWFSHWTAEIIFLKACNGFTLRNSRISTPLSGTPSRRGVVFVHAIWASGAMVRGDFIAENNRVELTGYNGALPHDEQFLGIFFSAFNNIRIVGNTIVGHDEGIEIVGKWKESSNLRIRPRIKSWRSFG